MSFELGLAGQFAGRSIDQNAANRTNFSKLLEMFPLDEAREAIARWASKQPRRDLDRALGSPHELLASVRALADDATYQALLGALGAAERGADQNNATEDLDEEVFAAREEILRFWLGANSLAWGMVPHQRSLLLGKHLLPVIPTPDAGVIDPPMATYLEAQAEARESLLVTLAMEAEDLESILDLFEQTVLKQSQALNWGPISLIDGLTVRFSAAGQVWLEKA
jgi:hypothetical protein